MATCVCRFEMDVNLDLHCLHYAGISQRMINYTVTDTGTEGAIRRKCIDFSCITLRPIFKIFRRALGACFVRK